MWDLVMTHAPALIVLPGRNGAFLALFDRLERHLVTFEITGRGPRTFKPQPAAVSFHHDGRSSMFLSSAEAWRFDARGPPRLLVRVPEQIVVESRRFPRFPVALEMGIGVRATSNDVATAPRLVDLGQGGCRLAYGAGAVPEWTAGTVVRLTLTAPPNAPLLLHAVVVRRSGNEFGLAFQVDARSHEAAALRSLIRGVAALS